jgi:hypothetical protein
MNISFHWLRKYISITTTTITIIIIIIIIIQYIATCLFNISYPNINLKFTTTKETENIIKSLKPKNSYGYDEIYQFTQNKLCLHYNLYLSKP